MRKNILSNRTYESSRALNACVLSRVMLPNPVPCFIVVPYCNGQNLGIVKLAIIDCNQFSPSNFELSALWGFSSASHVVYLESFLLEILHGMVMTQLVGMELPKFTEKSTVEMSRQLITIEC